MVSVCFAGSGCSMFTDGEGDIRESTEDVCEDAYNRFVSQGSGGLGVTQDQCIASERGQWIEGRCYCHGVDH